ELIGSLSVRRNGASAVVLPSYVAAITAMLTVAGPRTRRRTVRWSWNLLWVSLGTVAITGQVALLAVVVTLLLGRAGGAAVRYLSGVRSERAYGADLVRGVRQAGFAPVRLVRVQDVASEDDLLPEPEPGTPAAVALARYADNRVYAMTTETGERLDVVVPDRARQVVRSPPRVRRPARDRGTHRRLAAPGRRTCGPARLRGPRRRGAHPAPARDLRGRGLDAPRPGARRTRRPAARGRTRGHHRRGPRERVGAARDSARR